MARQQAVLYNTSARTRTSMKTDSLTIIIAASSYLYTWHILFRFLFPPFVGQYPQPPLYQNRVCWASTVWEINPKRVSTFLASGGASCAPPRQPWGGDWPRSAWRHPLSSTPVYWATSILHSQYTGNLIYWTASTLDGQHIGQRVYGLLTEAACTLLCFVYSCHTWYIGIYNTVSECRTAVCMYVCHISDTPIHTVWLVRRVAVMRS